MSNGAKKQEAGKIQGKAADTIIAALAEQVVEVIKDPEKQQEAIEAAKSAAAKVTDGVKAAAAVVTEKASEGAEFVAAKAEDVREAAENGANFVGDKVNSVRDGVNQRIDDIKTNAEDKKNEKAAAKQHAEDKAKTLATLISGAHCPTATFEEQLQFAGGAGQDYYSLPGCYVVLLLPKPAKKDKDFEKFSAVYVGADEERLSAPAHRDLTGLGNQDVYADYKFRKSCQYIFMVPVSDASLVAQRKQQLIDALDANDSYNKRSD